MRESFRGVDQAHPQSSCIRTACCLHLTYSKTHRSHPNKTTTMEQACDSQPILLPRLAENKKINRARRRDRSAIITFLQKKQGNPNTHKNSSPPPSLSPFTIIHTPKTPKRNPLNPKNLILPQETPNPHPWVALPKVKAPPRVSLMHVTFARLECSFDRKSGWMGFSAVG